MRIDALANQTQSDYSRFLSAVTGAGLAGNSLPYVLFYYPVLRLNPFHELLYGSASRSNVVTVPLSDIKSINEIGWGGSVALHLHWLHPVLKAAASEAEARVLAHEFHQLLRRFKNRGGKIIWTVHNVLPHQARFNTADVEIHKSVANLADGIHVMNSATRELAKPWYSLPQSRTFHVPHPSYQGWYGNVIERDQARQMLGIGSDERVFLCFGSIQPYKGLLELLGAFQRLRNEYEGIQMRLIIAGIVSDPGYGTTLRSLAASCTGVSLVTRSIPEEQVQVYFNAADVAVAPYTRTLNSGVALLAAAFRRPMIAPSLGAMAEVFGFSYPLLYGPEDSNGLLNAMRRSMTYKTEKGYFDRILKRHDRDKVSREFFSHVTRLFRAPIEV